MKTLSGSIVLLGLCVFASGDRSLNAEEGFFCIALFVIGVALIVLSLLGERESEQRKSKRKKKSSSPIEAGDGS